MPTERRAYKSIDSSNGCSSCLFIRSSANKAHHFPTKNNVNINRKQPLMPCPVTNIASIVSMIAKMNFSKTSSTSEDVGGSYKRYCKPRTSSAAYRIKTFART